MTVERLAPTIPVAEDAVRGLVPRDSLFDRLSAAGPGEGVLVCAPAGSGNTVLLRFSLEGTRELLDARGGRDFRQWPGAAPPADGRLGRGPAPGGHLAGPAPRPERCVTEFSGSERTVAGYLTARRARRSGRRASRWRDASGRASAERAPPAPSCRRRRRGARRASGPRVRPGTPAAERCRLAHRLRAPQAARARATAARACWTAAVSAPSSRAIWCASSRSASSTRLALRRLGCVRR